MNECHENLRENHHLTHLSAYMSCILLTLPIVSQKKAEIGLGEKLEI